MWTVWTRTYIKCLKPLRRSNPAIFSSRRKTWKSGVRRKRIIRRQQNQDDVADTTKCCAFTRVNIKHISENSLTIFSSVHLSYTGFQQRRVPAELKELAPQEPGAGREPATCVVWHAWYVSSEATAWCSCDLQRWMRSNLLTIVPCLFNRSQSGAFHPN